MKKSILALMCAMVSLSVAMAQSHIIKINAPDYINFDQEDSVTVKDGEDLTVKVEMGSPWSFGKLLVQVNKEAVEPEMIQEGEYSMTLQQIQQDTEVVFSIGSIADKGEIGKGEEGDQDYLIVRFPYNREIYCHRTTLFKEAGDEWEVVNQDIVEPIPSPPDDLLRNETDLTSLFVPYWKEDAIDADTKCYVTVESFHRYPLWVGEPVVIRTATTPVFTLAELGLTSNASIDQSKHKVYSSKGMIHIEADQYPAKTQIFALSGKLEKSLLISQDHTTLSIPSGVYIIQIAGETFKVLVE